MSLSAPFVRIGEMEIMSTSEQRFSIFQLPLVCPNCRSNAMFSITGKASADRDEEHVYTVEVPLHCTNCKRATIARYEGEDTSLGLGLDEFEGLSVVFRHTVPVAPANRSSAVLAKISPDFLKAFDEAEAASANGFEDLSGAGLRRALEFLVTDYVRAKHPTEVPDPNTAVGNLIKHHFKVPEIQMLAEEALKAGHDYVHTQRRTKRTLAEFRTLVLLISRFIEMQESEDEMQRAISEAEAKIKKWRAAEGYISDATDE
jgi:hypothetical protein